MDDFLMAVSAISHNTFNLLKTVEFPGFGTSCLVVFTTIFLISKLFRLGDFMTHSGDVPDNSNNYIYKDV